MTVPPDVPFLTWPFLSTGSTQARTDPDRWKSICRNVLDYGADATGHADSAPAIRAAMVASAQTCGGIIFFPLGYYAINTTIYIDGPAADGSQPNNGYMFIGEGDGSTWGGAGSFTGSGVILDGSAIPLGTRSMFKRINGASQSQALIWQGLTFVASGAQGGLIFEGAAGVRVQDCAFQTYYGVIFNTTIGRQIISNCRFSSSGNPSGSIGIQSNGNLTIQSCSFNGHDQAIRVCGQGTVIQGCEIEVNNTGIMVGQINMEGSGIANGRATCIEGNTFESNDVGIYLNQLDSASIRGNIIQTHRGVSPPKGGISSYGIYIAGGGGNGSGVSIDNNIINGPYAGGGIVQDPGTFCSCMSARGTQSISYPSSSGALLTGVTTIPLFYGTTGLTNPPWLKVGMGIQTANNQGTIIPSGTTITSVTSPNTSIQISQPTIAPMPDNTWLVVYGLGGLGQLQGGFYFPNVCGSQADLTGSDAYSGGQGTCGADIITRFTASASLSSACFNDIEVNLSSPGTFTIPNDVTAFPNMLPKGIYHITQTGSGAVTLTAGTGVTFLPAGSITTGGPYSVVSFKQYGGNTWRVWQGR